MDDSRRSQRSELWLWSVRGAGLGLGLLLIFIIAVIAQSAMGVIVMVLVSVLLAAALTSLVEWTRGRIDVSRVQVILIVYVLVIVLTAIMVVLLVPAGVNEMNALSARLPKLIADGKSWADSLDPAVVGITIERLLNTLETSLMRGGLTAPDPNTIVEFGLTAADALITVVTVLTLAFFWMISREMIQRFALALLPLSERRDVRIAWNDVEVRMGYWLRGQLTLMTAIGVLTTIAYFVLGLENALLLGVFAGIAEVIPIVGPAIGAVPALISAFVAGGPELALLVTGVYIVIQFLEGQILVPMVMKNAVGLPPFIIIVSLLVGAAAAGLIGALLAVPVAAAVAVILENAQARHESVALERVATGDPDDAEDEDEADAGKVDPGDPQTEASQPS